MQIFEFQELVWQIVHNVDKETAKNIPLRVRSPMIECSGLFSPHHNEAQKKFAKEKGIAGLEKALDGVKHAQNAESPRVIKTHLPFEVE